MRILSFFILLANLVSAPVYAQNGKDFQKLAVSFMNELVDAAKYSKEKSGVLGDEGQKKVKSVSAKIDFTALAKRSLGAKWAKYAAKDRKRFLDTLQELLEVVVYPKAQKVSVKSDEIHYSPVKGKPSQIRAETEIEREKKGELVEEKFEVELVFDAKSGKIIDALLEQELISANLKRNFDEALKKKTFQQIIDQMKKRVDEAKTKKA